MILAASVLPLPVVAIAVAFFVLGRWSAHVDYKRGRSDTLKQQERWARDRERRPLR